MPDPLDETDAVLARKLAEIAPPAGLRARLLALEPGPVTATVAPAWWTSGITALAAAIALALVALSLWPRSGDPLAAATADLSTFLSGGFSLAMRTPDVTGVRRWLDSHNADHPVDLPAALARNTPIGCRELRWRHHRAVMACFSIGGGREAHLVMFPAGTFADAPGAEPQLAKAGKWMRAAWSRDGMTYLLFVPEGVDPRPLIGALGVQPGDRIASSSSNKRAWFEAKSASGRARIVSPV